MEHGLIHELKELLPKGLMVEGAAPGGNLVTSLQSQTYRNYEA